jgi:hypothetical protein
MRPVLGKNIAGRCFCSSRADAKDTTIDSFLVAAWTEI